MKMSISDTQHNSDLRYAECGYDESRVLFIVMLSVIMLNVVMLSVVVPNSFSGFKTFSNCVFLTYFFIRSDFVLVQC
jgi:hypothetical protein